MTGLQANRHIGAHLPAAYAGAHQSLVVPGRAAKGWAGGRGHHPRLCVRAGAISAATPAPVLAAKRASRLHLPEAAKYTVLREGDEGWELRPSRAHPALHCWYAGYLKHGYTFRFRVQEMPDLVDDTVDWATYDALGQLVFARQGVVSVYSLKAKNKLVRRFEFDFESLAPRKPA